MVPFEVALFLKRPRAVAWERGRMINQYSVNERKAKATYDKSGLLTVSEGEEELLRRDDERDRRPSGGVV